MFFCFRLKSKASKQKKIHFRLKSEASKQCREASDCNQKLQNILGAPFDCNQKLLKAFVGFFQYKNNTHCNGDALKYILNL